MTPFYDNFHDKINLRKQAFITYLTQLPFRSLFNSFVWFSFKILVQILTPLIIELVYIYFYHPDMWNNLIHYLLQNNPPALTENKLIAVITTTQEQLQENLETFNNDTNKKIVAACFITIVGIVGGISLVAWYFNHT